ncbi:hypothetical protein FRA_35c07630 [Francisella sp. W12-1067]|nr:hypothetical protein FRA_35c07630 [Francisella sp. W12-1067]
MNIGINVDMIAYKKLKFKSSLSLETLFQSSQGYDNNFRDLNSPYKDSLKCSFQGIFRKRRTLKGDHYQGDFVWDGSDNITIGDLFFGTGRGGHPSLTEQGVTKCAGIIEKGSFFFHSGHFKPKARNVIPFMFKFIDNSLYDCKSEAEKQECLTHLCEKMIIRLYYDDSGDTMDTNFVNLCEDFLNGKYTFKKPSSITRNLIHEEQNWQPNNNYSVRPPSITKTMVRESYKWQPDSSSNNCSVCNQAIKGSFFSTNKHHCRSCGYIICGNCYIITKINNPLSGKGMKIKQGLYKTKVCTTCVSL